MTTKLSARSWPAALSIFCKFVPGALLYLAIGMAKHVCVDVRPEDRSSLTDALRKTCVGDATPFEKPLFQVTFFYVAHLVSILLFGVLYIYKRDALYAKDTQSPYTMKTFLLMFLPSLLDVVSNIMCITGLMKLSSSLSVLLKGTRIPFAAILTVLIIRKKRHLYHLVGVIVATVGIMLTACSTFLTDSKQSGSIAVGLTLAVSGEFVRALRAVVEEKLMDGKKLHPTYIHGIESIYGLALMIPTLLVANALPGGDVNNHFENLGDSLFRFQDSTILKVYAVIYVCAILGNLGGIYVIYYLSAVHNALVSESRALVVWIMELALYLYVSPMVTNRDGSVRPQFGKALAPKWYWALEVSGFIVVILASVLYHGSIRVPYSGGQEALLAKRQQRRADKAAAGSKSSAEESKTPAAATDDVEVGTCDGSVERQSVEVIVRN